MNKIIPTLVLALFAWPQSNAGSVTVPNTFIDGTTASAGEVNANFGAVESAINDNASNITANITNIQINAADIEANANAISALPTAGGVGVLFNGVRVGTLIGFNGGSIAATDSLEVLLPSSYYTLVRVDSSIVVMNVVFETSDCTGQGYVRVANYISDFSARQGVLFASHQIDPAGPYRYLPAGSTKQNGIQGLSWFEGNACLPISITFDGYKTYSNNPVVTGVTGSEFNGAMTLGY